jgi:hypothetical protein
MVIKNEYVKNLDYIFYELVGHPVRVQRREERVACLFTHTMPFEAIKCMMIFKMISSRSGENGMANKILKNDVYVKLEICMLNFI